MPGAVESHLFTDVSGGEGLSTRIRTSVNEQSVPCVAGACLFPGDGEAGLRREAYGTRKSCGQHLRGYINWLRPCSRGAGEREEVARLLRVVYNLKHKALLATAYSAGLRVGEDDRDLKGTFYVGEFVISNDKIYLITPHGQVSEIGNRQDVIG